jgi:L-ascorbate metabolism protein UlaG (beta-lactamase superfamily)
MKDFFFKKSRRGKPATILPSKKTDLRKLDPLNNVMVWFGHSSYFLQVDGKKILVDPVLSGNASPVKFTTRSFTGSDIYSVEDLPYIDYLFITHDHWDHLDHDTVVKLKPKTGKVITGLGVGAHLERWGYESHNIIERDWNKEVFLDTGFKVDTAPARHFSGRGFKRNRSLWSSFILATPTMKIFIGGDSGYDEHFKWIGDKYGPFDLAILENGQYNKSWKYIHMMPEETVQAAEDLKAKRLFPVHWGKFSLATHDWDDPIIRIAKEARRKNMPLLHPMIGEQVILSTINSSSIEWWTQKTESQVSQQF